MKKLIVILLFLLMATSVVGAEVNLGMLEKILSNKMDDNHAQATKNINEQADRCRADMGVWADGFLDEKESDYRNILWYDRVITFFLIFFAVFMAGSFKGWREHRYRVKERQIDLAKNKMAKKDLLASLVKSSTSAKWNGVDVVAVRKEFVDKLIEEVK